jgi:hypothetical protein
MEYETLCWVQYMMLQPALCATATQLPFHLVDMKMMTIYIITPNTKI